MPGSKSYSVILSSKFRYHCVISLSLKAHNRHRSTHLTSVAYDTATDTTRNGMYSNCAQYALLSALLFAFVHAQSTTILSLTSTTTIHAQASNIGSACSNFEGSCVVYGENNNGDGSPYTTTVYRESTPSPTSLVTSTTIIPATTTVSDADSCRDYRGACVVYAGSGEGAYTTTAAGYGNGQAGGQQAMGNSDGYIAMHDKFDSAVMGAGSSLSVWNLLAPICVGVVVVAMYA
jgi:hypothetical protein